MTESVSQKETVLPVLERTFSAFDRAMDELRPRLTVEEIGVLTFVSKGIARVKGLPTVRSGELLLFSGNIQGITFNTDLEEIGVVLLDQGATLGAGSLVRRTGRVLDVPVGEALIGRVIDPQGRVLDGQGPLRSTRRRPIEKAAPAILDRLPVTVPLETGLKVIDALIPIGRGQRELILGDRQTGKTAIAVDAMINQGGKGVVCIYCAIGKRGSAVAKVVADLNQYGAMGHSIVVVATEEQPPGLQFTAPYAAMTIAEFLMGRGRDVLVVFDDLTRHARAYRELSLLLRRPPGREAFPGDIFYVHSRLLERSTHLKEELRGGSITALPVVETEAQNISAYIPTNLISITDGQIYLSPDLFQKGVLPAVDVGRSVSRVGGKTQFHAYRVVAGDLRLAYSQFVELESFARFGTRLDEETRKTLERGRRVREVLKQPQYSPMKASEHIAVLLAVNEGLLDDLPLEEIADVEKKICQAVTAQLPDLCEKIERGGKLTQQDRESILGAARAIPGIRETRQDGPEGEGE